MKKTYFTLLTATFFAADLITKYLAASNLTKVVQITGPFSLNYQQNTGIAWSIPIPHEILIPLNLMLLFLIPNIVYKNIDLRHKMAKIILAFFIAGAAGNIFDRLVFGYVRDFISIGWWPIFNLADSYLCIGAFLILLFYGKIKKE